MIDFLQDGIKGVILDMDGVLWRDSEQIGNLHDVFNKFDELKIPVVLATNNASKTPDQYLEKLRSFSVELAPSQIATSGQAVVFHLLSKYPQGARVHVVGEPGLISVLEQAGFTHHESDVVAVVAGVDRSISYKKIQIAATLIRSGAEYIGTNPDTTFPTPQGLMPGAGSIIASISTAAEQQPIFAGKPGKYLLELSIQRLSLHAENVLVVGDRLETDILGAQNIGAKSALVLSGVSTYEQALAWQPAINYIAKDLPEIVGL